MEKVMKELIKLEIKSIKRSNGTVEIIEEKHVLRSLHIWNQYFEASWCGKLYLYKEGEFQFDNRFSYYENRDRATGRTTRLVDHYIQKVFTEGIVHIKDHYDRINAHRILFEKVMVRLQNEYSDSFTYNMNSLTIYKNNQDSIS